MVLSYDDSTKNILGWLCILSYDIPMVYKRTWLRLLNSDELAIIFSYSYLVLIIYFFSGDA